ncbi:MAG: ABC transporter permease [Parachlamydiaceae bacterium]
MNLNRIMTLMYKEILAIWKDKKSRAVLIVPGTLQLLLFSFAITFDVLNVNIAILNQDSGKQSIEFIEKIKSAPTFKKVTFLKSEEEIAPFINNQRGIVALTINDQFSRNLEAKKPASLQIILDGRKSNSAQIVAGYMNSIVESFNDEFVDSHKLPSQNAVMIPRTWFNPNFISYWFTLPNLTGVLTMLISLAVTALSVARERELGTFDQLLVSPIQPVEIMIGKSIPAIIIALSEATLILLAAIFYFEVPFHGSVVLLYTSIFFFASSIIGIGLFISALCQTQQQAILGTYIFMSPAVLLSGFATPIENMPDWLQTLTHINPLRYYLVLVKGIMLKSIGWEIAFHQIWPMAVIALINMTVASWLFKKRLQ